MDDAHAPARRSVWRQPEHRPTRITCTSSGTTRRAGDTRVQMRGRRRHGAPSTGGTGSDVCRRSLPRAAGRTRTRRVVRRGCRTPAAGPPPARARRTTPAPCRYPATPRRLRRGKHCSSEPLVSSTCRKINSRATMSRPRTHRCTNGRNFPASRPGAKSRTKAAGDGPIGASTALTDDLMLATRPKARPAAQTRRSRGRPRRSTHGRSRWDLGRRRPCAPLVQPLQGWPQRRCARGREHPPPSERRHGPACAAERALCGRYVVGRPVLRQRDVGHPRSTMASMRS